jgi:hypothetical protein
MKCSHGSAISHQGALYVYTVISMKYSNWILVADRKVHTLVSIVVCLRECIDIYVCLNLFFTKVFFI